MWRHHHYQAIVAAYENQAQHEPVSKNTVAYIFYQYVVLRTHSYPYQFVNKHLPSFEVSKL